jgi:indole-3-glycerol phosphate synthase
MLPPDTVVVSESGIRSPDDLRLLAGHNVHAVLIGELFMKAEDPGAALQALLSGMNAGVP